MTAAFRTRAAQAAAAACALAAAAAVQAEGVEIYGIIDTGLNYQHVDKDDGTASSDNLTMKSSQSVPNRWGMRGGEDLGNGWRAGFNLEGQFASDTGELTGGRLFHRMAQVTISNDKAGTLVLGRSGALRSGFGTTGIWGTKVNPFSNSWGDYMAGSKYIMPGGFKSNDNTITYQSPKMAGFQLHAQYSLKINQSADGVEGKSTSDRQWGLGATYTAGKLHMAAVLDSVQYGNPTVAGKPDYDDSFAFSLAAVYDFDAFKLYASGMYFADMKGSEFQGHDVLADLDKDSSYKGYSLQIGADVPLWGGTAKANIGWMDASLDYELEEGLEDPSRFTIAAGYVYPFSKRTSLYVGAGYVKDASTKKDVDPSAYEVLTGLVVKF